MTIGKEISNFLCDLFGLKFGKDFYYMRVPDEPGPVYWLVLIGSYINRDLRTKQKIKEYQFVLNYRDVKAQNVDEKVFEIAETISHLSCVSLDNFDLYDISASNLGTYEDADIEDRFKGSVQIVVRIHDDYHQ